MTRDIVEAIDNAIGDYLSVDAMRWTPDAPAEPAGAGSYAPATLTFPASERRPILLDTSIIVQSWDDGSRASADSYDNVVGEFYAGGTYEIYIP